MDTSKLPDPTNLGSGPTQLVQCGIAFLCITWIAVWLRVWARGFIIRSFGWDDWTMLITMVAFTCQCGYMIRIGIVEMHPKDNVNLPAISALVTDVIAYTGSYVLSTIFLKISLALFFLRIIIHPWQRNVIIYSLVVYLAFALVYFGMTVFGCGDPSKFLIHTAQGKCISIPDVIIPMSYAQTSVNAVMDWLFVLLPIQTLWYLRIPRSTKAWACALILLGALGSIASLIRLATVPGLAPGPNFFRASVPTLIWTTIEPGLGIAAGSFATLRPMFRRCIESTRTGYSSHRSRDRVNPSDIRVDLQCKGIPLSKRSPAERAGFQPMGSPETDFEVSRGSPDPEKGEDFERKACYERSPEGIWVQRTLEVHDNERRYT